MKSKEELLQEFRPNWKSTIDWLAKLPFYIEISDGDILVLMEYLSQVKSKIERAMEQSESKVKQDKV